MAITGYRILQHVASQPPHVLVEVAFDGDGYCYGVDEAGVLLWRPTDTWSINLEEGADETEAIQAAIAQWAQESTLPVPEAPGDWVTLGP